MKIFADENIPKARELFSAHGEVKTFHGRDLEPDAINEADVLLVRSITQVNEQLLKNSQVKFVGTSTIGTDHVDTDWLKTNKIAFTAPSDTADTSNTLELRAMRLLLG